jgi:hypothetical protein
LHTLPRNALAPQRRPFARTRPVPARSRYSSALVGPQRDSCHEWRNSGGHHARQVVRCVCETLRRQRHMAHSA